jgi:hypothetical protein
MMRVCVCIKPSPARNCANDVIVDANNALKALRTALSFKSVKEAIETCGCRDCLLWPKIASTMDKCMSTILCPQLQYPGLSYKPAASGSIKDAEAANIQHIQQKNEMKSSVEKCLGVQTVAKTSVKCRQLKAIHQSDFRGEFKLWDRKCSFGTCDQEACGVNRHFGEEGCKAIFEANEELLLKVTFYSDIARGARTQKELTCKDMSLLELREHIYGCLAKAVPKYWTMRWSNNYENLTLALLDNPTNLRGLQDFGAVVTIPTQDTMNQAIPARMLQCIIITVQYEKTVTLENGVSMKFNKTVDCHILAATGGTLDSNYFFVYQCIRDILNEYIIEGFSACQVFVSIQSRLCLSIQVSESCTWIYENST